MRSIKLIKRQDKVVPAEVTVVIPQSGPYLGTERNIADARRLFLNDLQEVRKRDLTIEDLWPTGKDSADTL